MSDKEDKKVMVEMVEIEVDLEEEVVEKVEELCRITSLSSNTIMQYLITDYLVKEALKK
jgi:hypothetical protein